jgi:hypothetical protein
MVARDHQVSPMLGFVTLAHHRSLIEALAQATPATRVFDDPDCLVSASATPEII